MTGRWQHQTAKMSTSQTGSVPEFNSPAVKWLHYGRAPHYTLFYSLLFPSLSSGCGITMALYMQFAQ